MANEEKEEHFVYDFGGNENLSVIKSKKGFYCYGFVGGTSVHVTGTDINEIEEKIGTTLTNAKQVYIDKANKVQAIALSIKESGLEKTAKDYQTPIKMNKQGDKK